MTDLVFHLLDIQSRDMRIESETDEVREISYESLSEDDGAEEDDLHTRKKRSKGHAAHQGIRRELMIHLFGATETGRPVRCDVSGFRPTFYIRLPEQCPKQATECIKQYIEHQAIPMAELTFTRVDQKVFYGFTASTPYPFLQIDVPSLSLFRTLRGLFLDDQLRPATRGSLDGVLRGKTLEIYEANIDPMLRFLHVQNIQPCNWVRIVRGTSLITEDTVAGGIVLECEYTSVLPTAGPRPVAPFLTASWDIECFSMTGDFPLAKRTWRKAAKETCAMFVGGLKDADLLRERILSALSEGGVPSETLPAGMTPIYCRRKKPMEWIRAHAFTPSMNEKWSAIVKKDVVEEAEMESLVEQTFRAGIHLVGDPVIQIGTTLTRGTADSMERHIFVYPDCSDLPGIEVHAFPTEKGMIEGWFKWIVARNPDILIGYNVFGFDEAYLWHRAEELNVITPNAALHGCNRLIELAGEMKLEEKFLSSSAMGDNRMYIWTTNGRLQIDMFHYIKRGYTLPSYKLDEVTKHFMSGKLKGFQYDESTAVLTLTVAGAVKDVRVGRSITLLDETGETISPKLLVSSVEDGRLQVDCSALLGSDALDTLLMELEDATKWVVVKDDVSPQDIFRLHRGTEDDRAVIAKYCIQDCDLVLDLYKKLETFNNAMSMANVCSVPVTYIFIRGQGIKIESLIFKFCREKGVLIPVLPSPNRAEENESYEGAIVLDPEPGFYSTSPIGVCDFASLYPSTIVSENISHDSLVWVKDFKDDGTLICHQWGSEDFDDWKGYGYTDIEYDIIRPDPTDERKVKRKIKCGRRICRFAQPLDGSKSTLPQITTWLLHARSAKKKEMKAEKDPERYALLDSEQLAYKLTGNSLYGQLGSSTFKIRLQALAASVTAYGRKQILFAKEAIEKFYGPGAKDSRCAANVMYGDTDSLFVEFNVKDPETGELLQGREARQATIDITDEAGHFITKALAAPHDFEFDKAFDPLLMFSKKRYAGNMYEENADDYVHKYMGIALKRRDNAPIVKTIFGGAMKMLLDKRDVVGAYHFVREKCMELVDGKVSMSQLTVTKSLRADYADPSRIAHKALADRITARDPGNAPAAGDRIGYVYIAPKAGQEVSKLQGDRIEIPQYIRDHGLVPDYRHYIEHQLQNPISQAFGLLLERIPGFKPDMIRGCPTAAEDLDKYLVFRESKAADLLFHECLARFNKSSSASAFMGMMRGGTITARPKSAATASSATAAAASSAASKPVLVQATMSAYMMGNMEEFLRKKEASEKKKKEKAAAAAPTVKKK